MNGHKTGQTDKAVLRVADLRLKTKQKNDIPRQTDARTNRFDGQKDGETVKLLNILTDRQTDRQADRQTDR